MSRSNSKLARGLREGSVLKQEQVAQDLLSGGDKYLEHLNKLQQFKVKSKEVIKETSIKFEWIKEQEEMHRNAKTIEDSIASALRSLELLLDENGNGKSVDDVDVDVDVDGFSACTRGLVGEMEGAIRSLWEHRRALSHQLTGLKGLLREGVNSTNSNMNNMNPDKTTTNNDNDNDGDVMDQRCATVAVLANVLVQVSSESLRSDLLKASEQAAEARRRVAAVLRPEQRSLRDLTQSMLSEALLTLASTSTEQLGVGGGGTENASSNASIQGEGDVELFLGDWECQYLENEQWLSVSLEDLAYEREQIVSEYGEGEREGSSTTGGWSQQDHDVFLKVYRRAQSAGLIRSKLSEQLQAVLPGKTRNEISSHEDWHRALQSVAQRKKEVVDKHSSRRDGLVAEGKQQLVALLRTIRANKQREEELRVFEERRQERQARLSLLREQKAAEEAAMQVQHALTQQQETEQQQAADLAQSEALEEKRRRVREFKQLREALDREQREQEDRRVRVEMEARRKQIDAAKVDVQKREELRLQKEIQRRQREEEAKESEEKRLQILQQLAAQVPYWDKIQNAKAMLSHITIAAAAHAYIPVEEEGTRGHLPLNGFTDERVFRDARFRLGLALHAAGLQHTEAARMVVALNTKRAP
eukprot:gene9797-20385_t